MTWPFFPDIRSGARCQEQHRISPSHLAQISPAPASQRPASQQERPHTQVSWPPHSLYRVLPCQVSVIRHISVCSRQCIFVCLAFCLTLQKLLSCMTSHDDVCVFVLRRDARRESSAVPACRDVTAHTRRALMSSCVPLMASALVGDPGGSTLHGAGAGGHQQPAFRRDVRLRRADVTPCRVVVFGPCWVMPRRVRTLQVHMMIVRGPERPVAVTGGLEEP